jgi:hypothetical protein
MQKVNEAYERLVKSDVKYRFAIDMALRASRQSQISGKWNGCGRGVPRGR